MQKSQSVITRSREFIKEGLMQAQGHCNTCHQGLMDCLTTGEHPQHGLPEDSSLCLPILGPLIRMTIFIVSAYFETLLEVFALSQPVILYAVLVQCLTCLLLSKFRVPPIGPRPVPFKGIFLFLRPLKEPCRLCKDVLDQILRDELVVLRQIEEAVSLKSGQ